MGSMLRVLLGCEIKYRLGSVITRRESWLKGARTAGYPGRERLGRSPGAQSVALGHAPVLRESEVAKPLEKTDLLACDELGYVSFR
jgi:hypothetical protein